jgi:hypothetical protein
MVKFLETLADNVFKHNYSMMQIKKKIELWENFGVTTLKYTIYVHCRKIYNLFVRALETGRKTIIWQAFLACFASSTNQFYIYRQCVYIVFILQYQNVQNNCQIV